MVKSLFHFTLIVCLLGAVLSCAKDQRARTELVLVADSDIPGLDSIRFEVSEGDRTESEEAAPRDDGEPLTLGVVYSTGSLGPIRVSALGIRAGRTVIERSAVVSFVPNKTLVVLLHLLHSCESKLCLIGRTCGERGCESNQLGEEQLSEWTGEAPTLVHALLADAGGVRGGPDAGAASDGGSTDGASGLATCGSDTKIDLSSDVAHCGDCRVACRPSGFNFVAACVAGECTEECRPMTGDCDGNPTNGCETLLSMSMNCGMCGMRCAAGSLCMMGSCR